MNPFESLAYGLMKAYLEHEHPRKGKRVARKARVPVPADDLFTQATQGMDSESRADVLGTLDAAVARAEWQAEEVAKQNGRMGRTLVDATNEYDPPLVDPQD